jgi:hypothetical protein
VLPISGASCRHAGTAPARSSPRRRAEHSVRSAEPARPGRRRSASGLGTGRRLARSASPLQTTRCCHRGCFLLAVGQERGAGRAFLHGITAALRRERCGPAVTRPGRTPYGARDFGRDPSIVGVQPSCQRSVPGIRIDSPSSVSPGGCRDSRRFTHFDPRRACRSGVLFRSGVCEASLWRSWFPREAGFAATTITGSPRRFPGPPRER